MARLSQLSRSVEGKVVLVTGAASGMGRATAELFADEGAKVIVTDLTEPQATYDALVRDVSPAHVLIPPLLKISREKTPLERRDVERRGAACNAGM